MVNTPLYVKDSLKCYLSKDSTTNRSLSVFLFMLETKDSINNSHTHDLLEKRRLKLLKDEINIDCECRTEKGLIRSGYTEAASKKA